MAEMFTLTRQLFTMLIDFFGQQNDTTIKQAFVHHFLGCGENGGGSYELVFSLSLDSVAAFVSFDTVISLN